MPRGDSEPIASELARPPHQCRLSLPVSVRNGASTTPDSVSFLLGSGVSIPAGMPSVNHITEKVLSGMGVMRHTDGKYYIGEPDDVMVGYVERVVEFLKRLHPEIKDYYGSRPWYTPDSERMVNYEDLYYVALQIYQSETGAHENPIVQAFIDKILPDIKPLFVGREDEIERVWNLRKIAEEATHYIHDIVSSILRTKPTDMSYLSCIGDACQDIGIPLNLFTLNHDTVLEQYLDGSGVEYTDGIESTEKGYRYWSPEVFEHTTHKVRLFKLHGSWNWFRYEQSAATGRNDPVGMAIDGHYWLIKGPDGELQRRDCGRSMLLVGTFNKIPEYTNRIFADLFCQFRRALRETDLLIVCGYSFGDQGINMQVEEWANSADKTVMVVIHKNPEDLEMGPGGNIYHNWDRWFKNKKLVVVEKWIEDTSWKDIQDAIRR